MIQGRFESFTKRPVVDCFIRLPSTNTQAIIPFLIDTGADWSVLMPSDANRLNVNYKKLTRTRKSFGIGGACVEYVVPALLAVSDEKTMYGYKFALGIAEPMPDLHDAPSIIGMDILRHWEILLSYTDGRRLEITVLFCDEETPVSTLA